MNVIITLTTIPERLQSSYSYDMRFCIKSLLDQNYTKKYEVHLNIPNVYKKTGDSYIIPEWLEEIDDSKLKIFRTDDYGSITKIIPTLQRLTEPDDIIIVVDDDMIYHPELINEHIKNRKQWPDYAVGYDGIRSRNIDGTFASTYNDNRNYYVTATGRNTLVDILQHYKSVSYRRRFFESDFYSFIEDNGTWCDDTCISAYFASKNRGRLVTFYENDKVFDDYEKYLENISFSFPITKYIEHGSLEGCNLNRADKDVVSEEKHTILYKKYLDVSYSNKSWTI
tara:strand:+ start:2214 stop:3059 length:846 start_codon:yes stop_codon:yes gene_type:complete